jgi:hypothetical protein
MPISTNLNPEKDANCFAFARTKNPFPTCAQFAPSCPMSTAPSPDSPTADALTGTIFEFTPVPMERTRANGWTPTTQRRFIHALSVMGSVRAAARPTGIIIPGRGGNFGNFGIMLRGMQRSNRLCKHHRARAMLAATLTLYLTPKSTLPRTKGTRNPSTSSGPTGHVPGIFRSFAHTLRALPFPLRETPSPSRLRAFARTAFKKPFPTCAQFAPSYPMSTVPAPESRTADALSGTIFEFTPVPMARTRADGWTPVAQRRFIQALSVMGSVRAAARAAGVGRVAAYRLRERAQALGGEALGFVRAWDAAVDEGRARQFDVLMDRAINGVTTIRVLRGGSVSVAGGPDMALINAALRDVPAPPPARA